MRNIIILKIINHFYLWLQLNIYIFEEYMYVYTYIIYIYINNKIINVIWNIKISAKPTVYFPGNNVVMSILFDPDNI